jgi:lipopolysaccharide biosynthesis glycosyltransferase
MPQRSSKIPPSAPTERTAASPARAHQIDGPCKGGGTMAESRVHLLLCTNSVYLQHVAVCLTSLLMNNTDLFFNIVVVGRAAEPLDGEKLRRSLEHFPNHSLLFREFTPPADRLLPLNPGAHYTLDTWTRLWVEEFFPADVNRVLYLDGDIVVVGGLARLWRTDLGGALLGAVDIPGSQRGVSHHGMHAEDGYFSAGVLLIDLDQWRKTGALETVLDYVSAHPERCPDVDQDALNACFHARRRRLEYKWNAIWPFFREPLALPLGRAEIEAVRREAQIIHFNGASKPWSYFCDHPRKAEYERYLRMTEWRDFVPLDRTPINRLRKGISAILPRNVKEFLKKIGT